MNFFNALHQSNHAVSKSSRPPTPPSTYESRRWIYGRRSVFHEALNNLLDLGFGGALLHYDKHRFEVTFSPLSHAVFLDAAHLVDDAFEDSFQTVGRERPAVVQGHVFKDLPFAAGS